MNKDEVIFAMITKRPVGWWALKVEVFLETRRETQGSSTTLCVFQKKCAYPRGSAQHSSFVFGMTFLSRSLSIVGRWNDPYDYRTTGRTGGRPALTYCGVEGQLSREARLHKLDQNCPAVDQVARKFYGLNRTESRHTSSSDASPPKALLTLLVSSMLSCMETLGGERHELKLAFSLPLND